MSYIYVLYEIKRYHITGKLISNIDSIMSLNYTKPNELEVVKRITLNDNSVYDIILLLIYKDKTIDVKVIIIKFQIYNFKYPEIIIN